MVALQSLPSERHDDGDSVCTVQIICQRLRFEIGKYMQGQTGILRYECGEFVRVWSANDGGGVVGAASLLTGLFGAARKR